MTNEQQIEQLEIELRALRKNVEYINTSEKEYFDMECLELDWISVPKSHLLTMIKGTIKDFEDKVIKLKKK